jgi:hypothetical protein
MEVFLPVPAGVTLVILHFLSGKDFAFLHVCPCYTQQQTTDGDIAVEAYTCSAMFWVFISVEFPPFVRRAVNITHL